MAGVIRQTDHEHHWSGPGDLRFDPSTFMTQWTAARVKDADRDDGERDRYGADDPRGSERPSRERRSCPRCRAVSVLFWLATTLTEQGEWLAAQRRREEAAPGPLG